MLHYGYQGQRRKGNFKLYLSDVFINTWNVGVVEDNGTNKEM
jgi:hypothetical protein